MFNYCLNLLLFFANHIISFREQSCMFLRNYFSILMNFSSLNRQILCVCIYDNLIQVNITSLKTTSCVRSSDGIGCDLLFSTTKKNFKIIVLYVINIVL